MKTCIFCLEKVKNKFIEDCADCGLKNLCMECDYKHKKKHNREYHKLDFKKLGYDNTACDMLDNMLNLVRGYDKKEGNNTGMF